MMTKSVSSQGCKDNSTYKSINVIQTIKEEKTKTTGSSQKMQKKSLIRFNTNS
jgi:hypothetical protein